MAMRPQEIISVLDFRDGKLEELLPAAMDF